MDCKRRPDYVLPYKKRLSALHAYYEKKFSDIRHEWEKFVSGRDDIDTSVIPSGILSAWRRCREWKLNPKKKPEPPILSLPELQTLLARHETLLQAALPLIVNFKKFVEGSRFLICLFCEEGYQLHVDVADDYKKIALAVRLVPGACWREEIVGANAFAQVLADKKPVQFFGPQHYNRAYHGETASSAPIFNPRDEFIGGVSLVSSYYGTNPDTLSLAVSLAQAIENRLKTQEALEAVIVASSYRQAILSAIPEALIAVDQTGRIAMVNDNALSILGLDRSIEGKSIRDVWGPENTDLFEIALGDKIVTDAEIRIASRFSERDFTVSASPIEKTDGARIGRILIVQELKRVRKMATKMIGAKAAYRIEDISGRNEKFLKTVEHIRIAARSDSNVLLLGESGTGKDLFAQAIHNEGSRVSGPFIAVNCASIPRDLIASELFGHSEGAFTGSRRGGNTGKFELADGGTIFFDEIAETSLEFQTALLRVVEERSIVRVGGTSTRPVNVRIISATNKNLLEEIKKGTFRSDLYYRLNVFCIETVPLRERPDDIPILIDSFIRKYGNALDKRITRVSDEVLDILGTYPWPGNIRELQNVIERMMNVAQNSRLTADLIPHEIAHWRYRESYNPELPSRREQEKAMIVNMMKMDIPRNKIAEKMNIARSTLYRKLKEYGLE